MIGTLSAGCCYLNWNLTRMWKFTYCFLQNNYFLLIKIKDTSQNSIINGLQSFVKPELWEQNCPRTENLQVSNPQSVCLQAVVKRTGTVAEEMSPILNWVKIFYIKTELTKFKNLQWHFSILCSWAAEFLLGYLTKSQIPNISDSYWIPTIPCWTLSSLRKT